MAFDPNKSTLEACIAHIQATRARLKLPDDKILTSRDVDIWGDSESQVHNVPGGFHKVILPFHLDSSSTFYISSAGPHTSVPKHSHDEGAGVRFIVSGSITYNGKALTQGDWMFLPAGVAYEFTTGPMGVTMFYCYSCCCA
jgi:hypothetical protein